ncbi:MULTISPECIES: hypothetical protein [Flavobacterium]|uniref:PKD domain-containing protein n=1 Tax=Flavobacterium panici TaxID=2654843 RepID=A0A9N8IYB1_9FLAO|nr:MULTISPECIES: hypothetical protein [Flavobacterium]UUF16098.1 hypothetical protein NLJ00_08240 [Flavobacterium panici]CAC9972666.1 hypothetical protein FLAPXU55_00343 [Flavobacterium panici]
MNLSIILKRSAYLMLAIALGSLTGCDDDPANNGLTATNVDAAFTIAPVAGKVNTYLLTAQENGVISSKWDIGYGPYMGKMEEEVVLPDAGTYTVTHTAIAAGGATSKVSHDIVVAASDPAKPNLVRGGFFNNAADIAQWSSAKLSATGAAFWSFNSGTATIHSPGGWAQEGIYQAIDVVKDKEYTIDMLVSCPSGSDETWFEVYAGKSVPKDGVEYKDNKVMGLSTWDGCAKGAFTGRLSSVGCVKNDGTASVSNVVKFDTTGKIYLLIRSGGNTFTKDGITVSRIEMRGK